MKKYIVFTLSILLSFTLNSCSNNEDESLALDTIEHYRFVFNIVSELESETRATKKDWENGDKIFMFLDNDKDNICILTYQGEGDWKVETISSKILFSGDKGSITAIHASSIDFVNGSLQLAGDILFTEEGFYTKVDNVICITLRMNMRPQAKYTIVGVTQDTYIEDFTQIVSLKSIAPIEWDNEINMVLPNDYDIDTKTATYCGLTQPDGATTLIKLHDSNGHYYERVYTQVAVAGQSILLKGPLSEQANLWKKITYVNNISLSQSLLNMTSGDTFKLIANLQNPDATDPHISWKSSNTSVADVDENGNVVAISDGTAFITISANDGSAEARCEVRVADINNFITITHGSDWSDSKTMGENPHIKSCLNITNNYYKSIVLHGITFSSSDANVLISFMLNSDRQEISFEKETLNSQECTKCNYHFYFAGYSSAFLLLNPSTKNSITLEYTIVDEPTIRYKKVYLPWELGISIK